MSDRFPAVSLRRTDTKEATMNRLMIVARLREGVHEQAEALLAAGPPFDPE
jgi:hypothetical protein